MNLRPWRAWHTFLTCLLGAALVFTGSMVAAMVLYVLHGTLSDRDTLRLLGALYWGGYPFVFVGLGALVWHFVKHYGGAYALRY